MKALNNLQAALEKEGLIAEIHGDHIEALRDWSYTTGINPWDEVDCYSDVLTVTFAGNAFIASDEDGDEIAREEIIAEYDPEAGITETDIKSHADNIAETIAVLLPERDILAEREEAYADYMAEDWL